MPTLQELKRLVFLFVGWRVFLFLLGFLAPIFLSYEPSFPYFDKLLPFFSTPQWFFSWANFDGVHYLTIADKGYIGTASVQAFFPLLPFVILHSLKSMMIPHYNALIVGLLITNVSTFALFVSWFSLVKLLRSARIAWLSLVLLVIFPTSFFLVALYTESLFLFLILMSFYCAEKRRWFWAGFFALLVSSTRIVGIFIVPALIIELFCQEFDFTKCLKHWQKKKISMEFFGYMSAEMVFLLKKNWLKLLWIACGSLGIIFYMVFLMIKFQDPFYFAHVQSSFGAGRSTSALISYPQVLYRSIHILLTARPFDLRYWTYVQEFLAGTVALVGLYFSRRYVRLSHYSFALAAFFIPTLTGTFLSMPRFLLVCFPLFIFLAEILHKRPKLAIVWIVLSTAVFIFNTMLFIQGYWVS